ncbi:MAG: glycosyltransferase [Hydrotalea sp.]|nr:glycosyltransferase [Hydrotalea sp.]
MTRNNSYKIFLVSGGTGGHSFPALSLATLLLATGHQPSVVSEQRGIDYFHKHFRGHKLSCPTYCLPLRSPQGGVVKKLLAGASLLWAVLPAIKLLRRERPAVVVGFGGYMMVPMFLAARLLGLRHVFLEQNAVIGRANRLFKSSASAIAIGLPQCRGLNAVERKKTSFVGTPIKDVFLKTKAVKNNNNGALRIFVTGGSQGAQVFADIVPRAMARLLQELPDNTGNMAKKITIRQQAKAAQVAALAARYDAMAVKNTIKDFFDDVPQQLSRADIFIGRAGASTLAEIAAMGNAAILIPFPFATDNHQYYNAKLLAAGAACRLLVEKKNKTAEDSETLVRELAAALRDLMLNPAARQSLSRNIKSFAKKNAGVELMKLVIATIEHRKK